MKTNNLEYKKISPKEYAKKLKEEYRKHPEKWYESIMPEREATELIERTHNDYSQIWHEHCDECYKTIDVNSEDCYVSNDGYEWLCSDCFNKLTK